ncbi:MAG TPA: DsrE family protein [Xanthomonadales bacterium]|nr:DsrE family protein [Xanthomonadales bacterium]
MMVLGDPAESSAVRLALRVLEAAWSAGAVLDTVFLYHKGAYAALNCRASNDEWRRWSHLASAGGLRCVVCQTAWITLVGAKAPDLVAPFQLGGLTDWLGACDRSDKVLRFGSLS